MSPGVEERVVSIRFDNAGFETKVASTIASIDKLNEKLGSLGAGGGKGFSDISAAAKSIDLSSVASGVDHVASRFTALGAIAFTAIQNITNSAIGMVKNWAKKDILDPIITGGTSRARNIEQAKFQFEGLGMNVQQAMDDALYAVKGTAYGLDEAAKAAAQFGASGVKGGDDMKAALRAISGTAALTGRSFGEMAMIFTGSAGTGKVTNQDFMQFATRGMNAAAAYAKQMGLTEAQVHQMARAGQIDFMSFSRAMDQAFGAHSTEASKTYAGALENMHAAMARLGASFIGPHEQQQRDLFNALTPAIDNVNSALQPLIESFIKVKGIATGNLIKTIQGIDFTNFKMAIPNFAKAFENAFTGVRQVFSQVSAAFREIFPAGSASVIMKISEAVLGFSEKLKMGGETANKVKSIFAGLFSILSIAWEVLKGLALVLMDVVKALFPASKGILSFGAGIGDFLTKLHAMLVDSGALHDFFVKLGEVIVKPINFIMNLGKAIANFFSAAFPDKVSSRFDSLSQGVNNLSSGWSAFTQRMSGVFSVLQKVGDAITQWFKELGSKIASSMSAGDFQGVVDVVNVGLLGGITLLLKKFFDKGLKIDLTGGLFSKIGKTFDTLTSSIKQMQQQVKVQMLMEIAGAIAVLTISVVALSLIDSVSLTKALVAISVGLSELVGTLAALSKFVGTGGSFKMLALSASLITLALAVDILAIAIKILGGLSWAELGKGLTGVAGGLLILIAAAQLMPKNPMLIFSAAGVLILSGALLVLSIAVKSFAGMSWGDMAKGLVGVGVGMALIVAAMMLIPASSVIGALGFAVMAIGLRLMADAVKAFGNISWGVLGKGLLGIAGILVIVAAAMYVMPATLPLTAAGMLILAAAISAMAISVLALGKADLKTLAKGLGAFAAMLLILAVSMQVMQSSIVGAAALIIAAKAIEILGKVLATVGKLSIAQIATGLGAIAAVLIVLGLAALVLEPVIPALLALGVALGVVGLAFALFGAGAFLVATAFSIMAVAADAGMKGIMAAIRTLQTAIPMVAATGALLIVNFAEEILRAAPELLKVLTALISQVLETITKLAPQLAKAVTALLQMLIKVINDNLPSLVQMGYNILLALMDGINNNMPEIINKAGEIIVNFVNGLTQNIDPIVAAVATLITTFITSIGTHYGEIIAAGVNMIINFLLGLTQDITSIITAVVLIITTLIQAIAANESLIIDAGFQVLTNFLLGISNNILLVADTVTQIITSFITALGSHILEILNAGFQILMQLMTGIANNIVAVANKATDIIVLFIQTLDNNMGRIITAGTQFIVHLITGIGQNAETVVAAGAQTIIKFIEGLTTHALEIANAAMTAIVQFVEGLSTAINTHSAELRGAGKDLAFAIADGLTGGLASKVQEVAESAKNLASSAWEGAKSFLHIGSPSKLFIDMGQNIGDSMALGMDNNKAAEASASRLADNITTAFSNSLGQIPDSFANMDAFSPTITPVLDLTKIQQQSTGIADALGTAKITPSASFTQAGLISSSLAANAAGSAANQPQPPSQVIFEQTINAPEALSTNDIYRNTKSQIALAKEELNIV
jgi:tape measure domain-containing protein